MWNVLTALTVVNRCAETLTSRSAAPRYVTLLYRWEINSVFLSQLICKHCCEGFPPKCWDCSHILQYFIEGAGVHWLAGRKVFHTRYKSNKLKVVRRVTLTQTIKCKITFHHIKKMMSNRNVTVTVMFQYCPWAVMTHWSMWFHLSDVMTQINLYLSKLVSKCSLIIHNFIQFHFSLNHSLLYQYAPNESIWGQSDYLESIIHSLGGFKEEKVSADKKETLRMIIIVSMFCDFWFLGQADTETDH